jgi:gluconate 2-dehydrogenase gamma chain
MAGQGIERRDVLRILSTAMAVAQFPGFSRWAFGCGHIGNAHLQIKPAIYHPQFFTDSEYALAERLAELIIPSDGTPGAKDAGVAEFIDFMVASDPDLQYDFRTGITELNARSERMFGKGFVELSAVQLSDLLRPLAYKDKLRPADEGGRRFFLAFRELTVMGFYTSEIGFKELDNPALKFYSSSPGCPHKDDPQHRHLSKINS